MVDSLLFIYFLGDYFFMLLENDIDRVEITSRLDETPCALVSNEYGHTANMSRIMKAQALQTNQMMMMGMTKPIMELNPHHKIINNLDSKLKDTTEDKRIVHDIIHLMFDSACVASGFSLSNSLAFSKRINRIVQVGLDCEDDDVFEDASENVSENNVSTGTNQSHNQIAYMLGL